MPSRRRRATDDHGHNHHLIRRSDSPNRTLRVLAASVMLGAALLLLLIGNRAVDVAGGSSVSSSAVAPSVGAATSGRLLVRHDGETADATAAELAAEALSAVAASATAGGGGGSDPAAVRYEIIHNVETVWTATSAAPAGVALMLHGCSHSATDWFDRAPATDCKYCGFGSGGWGLPEEKAVVRIAQERNLAVIAMSSDDRAGSKCWNLKRDAGKIGTALDALLTRPDNAATLGRPGHDGRGLPIYVFGASSGGSFAASVPTSVRRPDGSAFPIAGVGVQISSGGGLLKMLQQQGEESEHPSFPPVAFLHMPRDTRTARGVASITSQLKAAGVPVMAVTRTPHALTDTFFSDRIEEISASTSRALVRQLREDGFLDPKTRQLSADPRRSQWRAVVAKVPGAAGLPLESDKSSLSEVMNVAWAVHELFHDGVDTMYDFMFEHAPSAHAAAGSQK